MSYRTIAAILKGKWLIDPASARNLLPIVANVISGTTEFEKQDPAITLQVIGNNGASKTSTFTITDKWDLNYYNRDFTDGCTVVVPVQGALTKHDQECGPVGMSHISSLVRQLSTHDKVGAIVFDIDSPGGQVDGTQSLAGAIKASNKKTIAYINDGMACSAAYWIASACDEIYVSQKTDVVGSIGVYCSFADFKGYWEKEGLTIHEIYSRLSSEKNKDYKDAMEGDYNAVQDDLDFIAREFIAAVKANRPGINLSKGDPFKGATYYADQAIEIGLIDGIRTFDQLFNSTNTMENNTNTAAETTETKDVVYTVTGIAESISAMTPDEVGSLNAALASANLQVLAGDVALVTDEVTAELTELRNYKTTTEAWKKEKGAEHTEVDAKEDLFKEDGDQLGELVSKEMDYINKNYGF
jgi:ClpP class serine protease